ncbi:MAG: nucleotidyltransferase substrate binding protein [Endomicrobium sp.]|jgi:nucleotidyltransferase substrate binding protein (TIGR01987 family)|nr:nucleotidyltransferase substrate binding protein [Endomicrobium sp.]
MSEINTDFLKQCILTLEKSYEYLKKSKENSIEFEMYRNSLVKSFEMALEQSGKLLRKKITPYFATKKAVNTLNFKDLFRQAALYNLLTENDATRWFKYRDNRNNTAHDYGQKFAQETLNLIEDFLEDVKKLKGMIENG